MKVLERKVNIRDSTENRVKGGISTYNASIKMLCSEVTIYIKL